MSDTSTWRAFRLNGDSGDDAVIDRQAILDLKGRGEAFWLDIERPTRDDTDWLQEHFGFHPLALDDVHNNKVRPKQETYGDVLFTVFDAINLNEGEDPLDTVNLNIFLTESFIVTAHCLPLRTVNRVADRIFDVKSPSPKAPDRAYYYLLDGVIDRYFSVVDEVEDELAALEQRVTDTRNRGVQESIFGLKRRIVALKKSINPKREAMRALVGSQFPQISSSTRIHLRDVLDHVMRIDESLDSHRELVSGLRDTYMAEISNQMNEVMKLMSVIATLMLPLSFMTGLFGMNFEVMPGTKVANGFWILMGVMGGLAVLMIWYFRKNRIL